MSLRASFALVLVLAFAPPAAAAEPGAQPPPAEGAGSAASAAPGASPVDQARAHYKQGLAHFNLDEWKQAVEEFKTAYRLYPDPTFLYNIALCHRKLGEHAEALSFYKKYLRERPDAKNREEVSRRIAELEPIVAAEAKTQPKPVTSPEPPPANPPAPGPTSPGISPPPVFSALPPGNREPTIDMGPRPAPPTDEPSPLYKKWWFWAGVGAVVVAGSLTAVALSSGGTKDPMYHPGDLSPGQITVPTR
jgi:tetratricopeptide (TPR) repeat protein